ncbi:MAG TPA: 30S ribosome-binding factor RbfA [Opitutaceae bacterium]|nr:30S ribosome-binding factor RbfA [Opitutaceae bacterium]
MSNRMIRVNELVQRELSAILRKNYQSEAVAITITQVRVSPDLHDARVFISVVGSDEVVTEKLRWLRAKATEIRQEIGRRIVLKFLPKFEYRLDESTGHSVRMLQLLDELGPAPAPETKAKPESG